MSTDWNKTFKNFTEFTLCCICNNPYFGYGNNARPVAEGRCCDTCNTTKVIPARLNAFWKNKKFQEDNK